MFYVHEVIRKRLLKYTEESPNLDNITKQILNKLIK